MKTKDYSIYGYYRGEKCNPYANPFDLDDPLEGLFNQGSGRLRFRSYAALGCGVD